MSKICFSFILIMLTFANIGCGSKPSDADHPPNPPPPVSVDIIVSLSTESTTETLDNSKINKVYLIAQDSKNNLIKTTNLKKENNQATGTISLPTGKYIFEITIYNKNDYLIGKGSSEEINTENENKINITINIVTFPDPTESPITINVTSGNSSDKCQTIKFFSLEAIYVYKDSSTYSANNYFPSGKMGDIDNIESTDDGKIFFDGKTSTRINYTPTPNDVQEWAGIYFLPVPAVSVSWHNVLFGIDLKGFSKLTWATKGEKGGEKVEFFVGGVNNIFNSCPDSLTKQSKTIDLTTAWQTFEFDLSSIQSQLSFVVGGFGFAISKNDNPDRATFYLDEIKFVK